MSFECQTWAKSKICGGCIPKAVLMNLANTTNHQTGMCRPRIKVIAREVEASETAVKMALKTLVEKGYLKVIPRFADNQQLANDYKLLMEEGGSADEGVGREPTQGGSPGDPGWVGRRLPYNQEIEPGSRTTSLSAETADRVQKLYEAYPYKVAKGAALKAIEKALKKKPFEELMEAVKEFAAATAEWPEDKRREFIPMPSSWFNQERWEDDRASWRRHVRQAAAGTGATGAGRGQEPDFVARKRIMALQHDEELAVARRALQAWERMYGKEHHETIAKADTVAALEATIRRLGFEPGKVGEA